MSEEDVDWSRWVSQQRATVSEKDCARLRRRLVGTGVALTELADGEFGEFSRTQLSKHANGACSHDHGVAPVKSVRRWRRRE